MDRYERVRSGALLERDRELERLRAAVHAAGRRAGDALVIEGAAGIGKSRLRGEARERWLAGAAGLAEEVLTGALPERSSPAAGDSGYAWQHGLYWLASNV